MFLSMPRSFFRWRRAKFKPNWKRAMNGFSSLDPSLTTSVATSYGRWLMIQRSNNNSFYFDSCFNLNESNLKSLPGLPAPIGGVRFQSMGG